MSHLSNAFNPTDNPKSSAPHVLVLGIKDALKKHNSITNMDQLSPPSLKAKFERE